MADPSNGRGALAAGGLAAILASTCCLGPLVLITLGFSGAWIGSYFANSEKWAEVPDKLKDLFRLCMDSSHYYRQHWYWGGEAKLRVEGDKLKLTTIPAAEWQTVEDEARKFWDEIAKTSPRCAKVVETFKRYNALMAEPEKIEALLKRRGQQLREQLKEQLRQEEDSAEVKQWLRSNTEQAQQAGVFGVPAWVVDGHVFWGLDGLPMLQAYLRGDEWFAQQWEAAAGVPWGLE